MVIAAVRMVAAKAIKALSEKIDKLFVIKLVVGEGQQVNGCPLIFSIAGIKQ